MPSDSKGKILDVYIIPTDHPMGVPTKKPWWSINKEMLRFKVHFFLYLSAVGLAMPYLVVFAKDRVGISATSLGVVLTTQMFLFIFTKPMIGYLADYFNKLKAMITILTIVTGTCYFLLWTIPNYEVHETEFPNRTDDLFPSVANSELCEKHKDLQYPVVFGDESLTDFSLHEATVSPVAIQVFVVCFLGDSDAFTCLKQCSDTQTAIRAPINHESESHCEIVEFGNDELSNCSVHCIKDKSLLCHPENNASDCIEEICPSHVSLLHSTPNSSSCVYFGNLKDLCREIALSIESKDKPLNDYMTYQFWVFTILFTIASVCANAIFTLSDTACNETIQKTGGDFGQQRLWGAIGWGLAAPLSGFINDVTGDYLVSWIAMAVMMALFLLNISQIDLVKPHFSKNILRDVGTIFKSREFLAFEISVFMNGVLMGMIWYYLIWFLTSIGGSKLLCGLSLAVQSFVGVIPLMFFSGMIIKKVGHYNVVIMALAANFVRFLWYSYLHNPWLVLPIEFIHGLTYGLYYTTLASYGKLSSKPGTEATTQAVIFSTNEGLGAGIGCVLAGYGFDTIGGHMTFYYSSVFSACGVVLSLVLSLLLDTRMGEMEVTKADAKHGTQNGNGVVSCTKFESTRPEV